MAKLMINQITGHREVRVEYNSGIRANNFKVGRARSARPI